MERTEYYSACSTTILSDTVQLTIDGNCSLNYFALHEAQFMSASEKTTIYSTTKGKV